jgi:hypothetical protein
MVAQIPDSQMAMLLGLFGGGAPQEQQQPGTLNLNLPPEQAPELAQQMLAAGAGGPQDPMSMFNHLMSLNAQQQIEPQQFPLPPQASSFQRLMAAMGAGAGMAGTPAQQRVSMGIAGTVRGQDQAFQEAQQKNAMLRQQAALQNARTMDPSRAAGVSGAMFGRQMELARLIEKLTGEQEKRVTAKDISGAMQTRGLSGTESMLDTVADVAEGTDLAPAAASLRDRYRTLKAQIDATVTSGDIGTIRGLATEMSNVQSEISQLMTNVVGLRGKVPDKVLDEFTGRTYLAEYGKQVATFIKGNQKIMGPVIGRIGSWANYNPDNPLAALLHFYPNVDEGTKQNVLARMNALSMWIAHMRNTVMNMLSGAAISPEEAKRLMEELSDIRQNPHVAYNRMIGFSNNMRNKAGVARGRTVGLIKPKQMEIMQGFSTDFDITDGIDFGQPVGAGPTPNNTPTDLEPVELR